MSIALAEKILERPDAVMQLKHLQSKYEEEKKRRKYFREWVTEVVKAEFINGEVVIHSPVMKRHWRANDLLSRLLSFFLSVKEIGMVGTEKVMIALTRNDYEPDIVYFSKGKTDQFTEDQVLFPAPDFVVEILSKSTSKTDRTTKKDDYALHGVREYWIVDPVKQRVNQYILPEGDVNYFPAKVFQSGTDIESYAIRGFVIPVAAIFDEAANMEAMKNLLK